MMAKLHTFMIKIIAAIIIVPELLSLICLLPTCLLPVQSLFHGNSHNNGITIRRPVIIRNSSRHSENNKSAIKKPPERQGSLKRRTNLINLIY